MVHPPIEGATLTTSVFVMTEQLAQRPVTCCSIFSYMNWTPPTVWYTSGWSDTLNERKPLCLLKWPQVAPADCAELPCWVTKSGVIIGLSADSKKSFEYPWYHRYVASGVRSSSVDICRASSHDALNLAISEASRSARAALTWRRKTSPAPPCSFDHGWRSAASSPW